MAVKKYQTRIYLDPKDYRRVVRYETYPVHIDDDHEVASPLFDSRDDARKWAEKHSKFGEQIRRIIDRRLDDSFFEDEYR